MQRAIQTVGSPSLYFQNRPEPHNELKAFDVSLTLEEKIAFTRGVLTQVLQGDQTMLNEIRQSKNMAHSPSDIINGFLHVSHLLKRISR
jgi:hypothetical protein